MSRSIPRDHKQDSNRKWQSVEREPQTHTHTQNKAITIDQLASTPPDDSLGKGQYATSVTSEEGHWLRRLEL